MLIFRAWATCGSGGLNVRQSLPARHNPSMKKKKGPVADNWKKKQLVIRKPTEVVHSVDPEPLLNPALLDASRQCLDYERRSSYRPKSKRDELCSWKNGLDTRWSSTKKIYSAFKSWNVVAKKLWKNWRRARCIFTTKRSNRSQNKGRSTDGVRPRWLFDRTNFRFGGHFSGHVHGFQINN